MRRLNESPWLRIRRSTTVIGSCWVFTGGDKSAAYGRIMIGSKLTYVHRWVYEQVFGAVPKDLVIDHVTARGCTSKRCWNPSHLEAVTTATNTMRGDLACRRQTHCKRGHPLSGDNLFSSSAGRRVCRACSRAASQKIRDRRKAGLPASVRFINPIERLRRETLVVGDCWVFTGGDQHNPHGRTLLLGKRVYVHRWMFEYVFGKLPKDMVVDHVSERGCISKRCWNPDHLEAVTQSVNVDRGLLHQRTKTHCPQGHPYKGENLFVNKKNGRECRTCNRAKVKRWQDRQRELAVLS